MERDWFLTEPVAGYQALFRYLECLPGADWVFRAQQPGWRLETSLERACLHSGLDLGCDAAEIEDSTIRQFRRLYDGNDREKVRTDSLYCISLMRHHGAPTRLLDFTYSPYVAVYFAFEYAHDRPPAEDGSRSCAVWCVNTRWCMRAAAQAVGRTGGGPVGDLVEARGRDETRDDTTFVPLYMKNRHYLVLNENPIQLHHRLHLQQALFLCPGSVRQSFEYNIKALFKQGVDDPENPVIKVVCTMDSGGLRKGLDMCRRMNISRESLFPGLDGFASSMRYQAGFYRDLYEWARLAPRPGHDQA